MSRIKQTQEERTEFRSMHFVLSMERITFCDQWVDGGFGYVTVCVSFLLPVVSISLYTYLVKKLLTCCKSTFFLSED